MNMRKNEETEVESVVGEEEGATVVDSPDEALRKTVHELVDKANHATLKRMKEAASRTDDVSPNAGKKEEEASISRLSRLSGAADRSRMEILRGRNPVFVDDKKAQA
jgi:hypothetical protein